MIRSIEDFTTLCKQESAETQRVLDAVSDASLAQPVSNDHHTKLRVQVTRRHSHRPRQG